VDRLPERRAGNATTTREPSLFPGRRKSDKSYSAPFPLIWAEARAAIRWRRAGTRSSTRA